MDYLQELFKLYGSGLFLLADWTNILLMVVGAGIGVFFGALPGLTSTMALVVFTPMTFGMEPGSAILFLMGLYVGSVFGGAISAISINIPGTPNAMATALDGYALTKKGETGKAISVATMASAFGTLLGLLPLMLLAPLLVNVFKQFGSWEYTAIAFLGLTVIGYISEGHIFNGLIGASLGLFIATIGYDPVRAFPRFTFGIDELTGGFDPIVVMIGVFGFAEMFKSVADKTKISAAVTKINTSFLESAKEIIKHKYCFLRSSLIGILIGIFPGVGGGICSIASYGIAKQFSKEPEKFGKGSYEGVIASESANNSGVGGALIPTLTLGIPGDSMAAVMIGALMLHGLVPGPLLFNEHPEIVSSVFIGIAFASVAIIFWGLLGANVFTRAILTPSYILNPTILILCIVGSYAIRYNLFDVGTAVVFGLIAFYLDKLNISTFSIVIGMILGPLIEDNLRRSLLLGNGSLLPFITRPVSLVFIIINIIVLIGGIRQSRFLSKSSESSV